eukprot:877179-Prorocentrum_minimum.AAC.1
MPPHTVCNRLPPISKRTDPRRGYPSTQISISECRMSAMLTVVSVRKKSVEKNGDNVDNNERGRGVDGTTTTAGVSHRVTRMAIGIAVYPGVYLGCVAAGVEQRAQKPLARVLLHV